GTAARALAPMPNSVEAAVARYWGSSLFSISTSAGTAGSPTGMMARLALPRASGSALFSWDTRAATSGPAGARLQAIEAATLATSVAPIADLTPRTVRVLDAVVNVEGRGPGSLIVRASSRTPPPGSSGLPGKRGCDGPSA